MDIHTYKFKDNWIYVNLFLHILCYLGLFTCLLIGSTTTILYMLLVYLIIGINEQAFFHRLYTHRSWNCPEWMKIIGLLISNLSLLGPVTLWVALHREHHRYNDTLKDPHSPLYINNFKIQFLSSTLKFNPLNASDLIKDKTCLSLSFNYFETIFFIYAILLAILGPLNFFMIVMGGTGLVLLCANSINTWHHGPKYYFGQYQNVNKVPDTSKNDIITGYLTFDGWHSNHHNDPRSYYYGKKFWEIDLCGIYIYILATLTGYKSSLKKST